MSKILAGWIIGTMALSGYGVWATYSDRVIDEADEDTSLKEDSVTGTRPLYFYKRLRGPKGGGLKWGK